MLQTFIGNMKQPPLNHRAPLLDLHHAFLSLPHLKTANRLDSRIVCFWHCHATTPQMEFHVCYTSYSTTSSALTPPSWPPLVTNARRNNDSRLDGFSSQVRHVFKVGHIHWKFSFLCAHRKGDENSARQHAPFKNTHAHARVRAQSVSPPMLPSLLPWHPI